MLAYFDVGLGLYAALLWWPSRSLREARRLLARHSLLTVYTAVLVAASIWPIIILGWLLSLGGEHDQRP